MRVKVIGKDNVGWSIDRDRSHLVSFLADMKDVEVTESYWNADVYFFVWLDLVRSPRYFFARIMRRIMKKKIIAWITNDVTQNKEFLAHTWPVDLFISPSSRTSEFLGAKHLPYIEIPFFVSNEVYKELSETREVLAEKLAINYDAIKNKFLIGTFQRDSLGEDLTRPKWQKNPDLLIEILKTLPKEKFVLVLAGPRRHYLINCLRKLGIPYVFVGNEEYVAAMKDDMFENNLPEETINMLYSLIDMNIVTSVSEGGPKAVLESALTKTLIVSTDVGNARDILHPDLVFRLDDTIKMAAWVSRVVGGSNGSVSSYVTYNYDHALAKLEHSHYLKLLRGAIMSV